MRVIGCLGLEALKNSGAKEGAKMGSNEKVSVVGTPFLKRWRAISTINISTSP
jgi:hypothetical protein